MASTSARSPSAKAWNDIHASLFNARFWISLAWIDIIQRYRGSLLGPFWLTISTGVFIVGLGPLYSQLFKSDLATYLPYLTLGILVWTYISSMISESCRAFIDAGGMMKQMKMPRSTHLLHILARNIIIFFHGIPLFGIVIAVFHLPVTWVTLLAVPGFIVLSAELIVLGLILAIISVRYRDFIQIVASVLQLLFFVSPIFWQPGDRPVLQLVSDWNPISAMIALVRNPLLNELPSGPNLVVTAGGLAVLSALAFLIFARFRQRIIYWV